MPLLLMNGADINPKTHKFRMFCRDKKSERSLQMHLFIQFFLSFCLIFKEKSVFLQSF